jgi:hypothetical protein
MLPLADATIAPTRAKARLLLAQAQIQIPSDAQLDRMEREGIATPPLYDGDAKGPAGVGAENRQMEEQARRIDEKLLGGGICSGC